MCKHKWINLMPPKEAIIDEGDRIEYVLKTYVMSSLGSALYCQKCGRTGHYINSRAGGIRVHTPEGSASIIEIANEVLAKYKLPLIKKH